ncbi:hypothetical protein OG535_25540 [Kitasatospora sp. NBC_00085]
MTEPPTRQYSGDVEALEPLRVWTACAVSAAALFHLLAAALVLAEHAR